MRLPLFILKTGGSKSWFVPHAMKFLGDWCPRIIVEPFAGTAVVGLSLLYELLCKGSPTTLVLAEKDKDYLQYWQAALRDANFSYRLAKWTERVLRLPFEQQKPFVMASLEKLERDDPGLWILIRSRVAYNGKKTGGYMTERHRGGILSRWPRDLDASLDLLYRLRSRITVMEDAFEALARFNNEDCYAFVDAPYTMTETCPGHNLYDEAIIDHDALLAALANWKGRWQLTSNICPATLMPTMQATFSGETTGVAQRKTGILYAVPGVEWQSVEMISGLGRGGTTKKWELVVSKV